MTTGLPNAAPEEALQSSGTLRNTLAEIVLETTREELVEALGEEGFAEEAERGRAVVQKALREAAELRKQPKSLVTRP